MPPRGLHYAAFRLPRPHWRASSSIIYLNRHYSTGHCIQLWQVQKPLMFYLYLLALTLKLKSINTAQLLKFQEKVASKPHKWDSHQSLLALSFSATFCLPILTNIATFLNSDMMRPLILSSKWMHWMIVKRIVSRIGTPVLFMEH